MPRPKPVLLLILDGWGERAETAHNAIAQAHVPNWTTLRSRYPHTLVETHGLHVGLPDGQMGNSEVGHMNIGAGRIVYQDLTRIDADIADGGFFDNAALRGACDVVSGSAGTLHVLGLLSPGGVHSHEKHIHAMLDLAARRGVANIVVHAFLDGRDTPPQSARESLLALQAHCAQLATPARIGSICGRFFAMDRDNRWDRVQRAYEVITDPVSAPFHSDDALAALDMAYARGESDEFVQPTAIAPSLAMADGDAVVFMNFRADRAREISHAFVDPGFDGFVRAKKPQLAAFVTLTEYEKGLAVSAVAYLPATLDNSLGEYLAELKLRQLRIAETEKYAHVTFFFSGGREAPFAGEERVLIPSPQVETYDLQPEMSCPELTDALVEAIESGNFDFIVCNIANPDMVGHTGNEPAAIAAVEAVDVALGRLYEAITAAGGEMLVTADHGNVEQMRDDQGRPHTQHTVGPVPLVYVGRPATLRRGALRDLAPTVLALMDLPQPKQMSGSNLVEFID